MFFHFKLVNLFISHIITLSFIYEQINFIIYFVNSKKWLELIRENNNNGKNGIPASLPCHNNAFLKTYICSVSGIYSMEKWNMIWKIEMVACELD